jgi:hypothetical protein
VASRETLAPTTTHTLTRKWIGLARDTQNIRV